MLVNRLRPDLSATTKLQTYSDWLSWTKLHQFSPFRSTRPCGHKDNGKAAIVDRPYIDLASRLDYELEVGAFYIGPGNPLGQPIPIA